MNVPIFENSIHANSSSFNQLRKYIEISSQPFTSENREIMLEILNKSKSNGMLSFWINKVDYKIAKEIIFFRVSTIPKS